MSMHTNVGGRVYQRRVAYGVRNTPPGQPKPVDKEAIKAKRKEERNRKKENR
jgi:hypothetical protein